jgi:hypothetical protein
MTESADFTWPREIAVLTEIVRASKPVSAPSSSTQSQNGWGCRRST